ncbi:MAG: hypothetical protein AAFN74_08370 [Myxococcota bacterium]
MASPGDFIEGLGEVEASYRYAPSLGIMAGAGLLFGICAAIGLYKYGQDDDLVALMVGIAASCFVVLAALALFWGLLRPQRIVVGTQGLLVPQSRWSSREVIVRFSAIEAIDLQEISGQRMLTIRHLEGIFRLQNIMLPRGAFDILHATILRACGVDEFELIDEPSSLVENDLWSRLQRRGYGHIELFTLKILVLFSFCGGPLYLCDHLKAIAPNPWNFVIAFAPLAVMMYGALSFSDDTSERFSRIAVKVGFGGALILFVESFVALTATFYEPPRADGGLIATGSVIGLIACVLYIRLARLFLDVDTHIDR